MGEPTLAGVSDEQLRPALDAAFAVAVEGRTARPPVAPPDALRPYLRFQRLPRAALSVLRRALDDDAAFRARVAAATTPDGLGPALHAWLVRAEGWEASVREALARAGGDGESVHAGTGGRADATSLREAKRRAAAESAAARAAAELADVRQELARERVARTEAEAAAGELRRQVELLRGEVDGLQRRARRAEQVADTTAAQLHGAEARAADLQRTLDETINVRDLALAERAALEDAGDAAAAVASASSGAVARRDVAPPRSDAAARGVVPAAGIGGGRDVAPPRSDAAAGARRSAGSAAGQAGSGSSAQAGSAPVRAGSVSAGSGTGDPAASASAGSVSGDPAAREAPGGAGEAVREAAASLRAAADALEAAAAAIGGASTAPGGPSGRGSGAPALVPGAAGLVPGAAGLVPGAAGLVPGALGAAGVPGGAGGRGVVTPFSGRHGRGGVRRARRRPLAMPGGVSASSVQGALHLLRAPELELVVDGYNVAMLAWPALELAQRRERCIEAVEDIVRRFGTRALVVFDGADVSVAVTTRRLARVRFSPPGVLADDVIRDVVAALPVEQPVAVATNDRAVAESVRAMGANTIASETLLAASGRAVR